VSVARGTLNALTFSLKKYPSVAVVGAVATSTTLASTPAGNDQVATGCRSTWLALKIVGDAASAPAVE
jgi:hypothetical protein